jgi:hypothetical protein
MEQMKKTLCFLLILGCLIGMGTTAYAAPEKQAMWNMQECKSENTNFQENFTDAFGNTYCGAVCFDVTLGSSAEYDLSGRYSSFVGTLTTSDRTDSKASFDFAIVLDGKIVYYKQDFTKHSPPEQFEVDLTGAKTMQVLTDVDSTSYTFLFVADGYFTPAEEAIPSDTSQLRTLSDVVLVDSSCYREKILTQDAFGNPRANNYMFGDRGTGFAVYNLNKDYDTFCATVFAGTRFKPNITRSCSIYCDGELVANYEGIDKQTNPITIEVDVRNVSVLKIESHAQTTSAWNNTGFLIVGDAYLAPHVHIPGEISENTAPTCTKQGKKNYVCTVCGEICGEEIFDSLGHTPGEWVIDREADCSLPGLLVSYCQVCDDIVEAEEIARLAHTPAEHWTIVSEATCYEEGVEVRLCMVCGDNAEERIIPMVEHQMGGWKKRSGSLWDAPIYRVRDCTVCSATEEEYEYVFAWIKPLVFSLIMLFALAMLWCHRVARNICGPIAKKRGLIYVLRAAVELKEDDLTTAASKLQEVLVYNTEQQESDS